jgi:hypothetical protein
MSCVNGPRLAVLASVALLPGCDLLKVMDHLCLSRVLEVAEVDAEALKGVDADARLEEAIEIAADVLGELPVLDCDAEASFDALLGDLGDEGGVLVHAWQAEDVSEQAGQLVEQGVGRGGEVALVIDTTGSMHDDTRALRDNIDRVLVEVEKKGGTISVVFFGDNQQCDSDWYKRNRGGLLDPSDDRIVKAASNWEGGLTGGCDWQESMYDAVWKTANELEWQSDDRRIIVITDADPHDSKTNHTQSDVEDMLSQNDIVLDTILVGLVF